VVAAAAASCRLAWRVDGRIVVAVAAAGAGCLGDMAYNSGKGRKERR
jgi:hypothetical protein